MVIECLECNKKCETPFTLAFLYKIEHKDRISESACGDVSLSGICMGEAVSRISGAGWHATDGVHSYKTNCSSSSFKSSSISNSSAFSNSNSISSSKSNSDSNSKSSSKSSSIPSSSPKPSSTYRVNQTNIKFDITNKICNKCKVIKQITSFDKKKSVCKECNSRKVNSENCSFVNSFSGLRSHIESSHRDIDLAVKLEARNIIRIKFLKKLRDKRMSAFLRIILNRRLWLTVRGRMVCAIIRVGVCF